MLCTIESFTNSNFPPEVVDEAGICQNCFIRFNEYDEHQTLAEQIKKDLISLFESSAEYNDTITPQRVIKEEEIVYEPMQEEEKNDEIYFPKKLEEDSLAVQEHYIETLNWTDQENVITQKLTEPKKIIEVKLEKSRVGRPSEFVGCDLKGSLKLFECNICLRMFKEKSKLKAHREIHTTERNVVCPVSGCT